MRVIGIGAMFVWISIGTGCLGSSDDSATGTLSANLVGSSPSGAIYRLRDAIITVQGPATMVFNSETDLDLTSLSANVGVGDYAAVLQDGWRLERVDGSITTPVVATLISDNPAFFTVVTRTRTSVPLRFRVEAEDVDMTQGYDIVIGIEEAARGTLVAINDSRGHLERIDPTTLTVTDIGALGVGYFSGDCAWDPADSTLYVVDGTAVAALYRVDLTTGAATRVGVHGVPNMLALGYYPPTNQLYGIAFPDNILYSISTTTGAATPIGPTGLGPSTQLEGLAWDSKRNVMVGLTEAPRVELFSIDVSTGDASGRLPIPDSITNLGITYEASIDRISVVDSSGRFLRLDPGRQFANAFAGAIGGAHTCVAFIPAAP